MRAAQGDDASLLSFCRSPYPCETPYEKDYGSTLMKADLAAAKKLLSASGYKGEKTVVINPTDFPAIGPLGQVTADLLAKIGFNVDLQVSDWGTVVQRRTNRDGTDKGGWSVFHTFGGAPNYSNPAVSSLVREQGASGWFGWPENPNAEAMVQEWLDAPDEASRTGVAQRLCALAKEDCATIPVERFYIKTAYRKSITGVLQGIAPYPTTYVRPDYGYWSIIALRCR